MGLKSITTTLAVFLTTMILLTGVPNVMGKTKNQTKKIDDKQVQAILADKIDINSADVKTLALVKGIGEKKAQSIIDYRKIHGSFKNVDELINIKGIGDKTLKKFKKYLKAS